VTWGYREEIESHLELHIEDNLRAGMTLEEARRQARLKFGGIEAVKESYRDRLGIPLLDTLVQDLRYGLRVLRRNPGFTAVAVLSLALVIGANTAIFTLMDGLLLRMLPVQQAERLYTPVWSTDRLKLELSALSPFYAVKWMLRGGLCARFSPCLVLFSLFPACMPRTRRFRAGSPIPATPLFPTPASS
jgi:hypothetical protein